ncbi:MAG: antibiotic biosynthesis monooxygenase [SAR202 cluster bacterium]|nr:antibiotic biosynthesis monooxygenase [SAR202 cluster bacterium]|tara:strand:- start:243 stop:515 length:273 start_codon:yes stop_codon:yes gene_type:complete
MTAYTIATHPVKDFEIWKAAFDSGLEMRQAAGELSAIVIRGGDDGNQVTVINTWASLDQANAMLNNPEMKPIMEAAGVLEFPTIIMGNSV